MWTFPVFLSSGSGLVKYPVDYQMAWYYHTDLYCNTVVLFFLLVKGNGFHREISRNSLYSWMLRRPVIVEVLNAKRQGGVPLTICTTFHLWIQSLQILHLKSLQKHDHLVQLRYIFFLWIFGRNIFFLTHRHCSMWIQAGCWTTHPCRHDLSYPVTPAWWYSSARKVWAAMGIRFRRWKFLSQLKQAQGTNWRKRWNSVFFCFFVWF